MQVQGHIRRFDATTAQVYATTPLSEFAAPFDTASYVVETYLNNSKINQQVVLGAVGIQEMLYEEVLPSDGYYTFRLILLPFGLINAGLQSGLTYMIEINEGVGDGPYAVYVRVNGFWLLHNPITEITVPSQYYYEDTLWVDNTRRTALYKAIADNPALAQKINKYGRPAYANAWSMLQAAKDMFARKDYISANKYLNITSTFIASI